MSWTNPSHVIRLVDVFFERGAPFKTALTRETLRLVQAVKIRNRVAHASEKCKTEFRKAANIVRGLRDHTPLGRGFRVGELLSETAGPFFGANSPALSITIFDAYMRTYKQLAEDIVPK
jgi:hypothetical protein